MEISGMEKNTISIASFSYMIRYVRKKIDLIRVSILLFLSVLTNQGTWGRLHPKFTKTLWCMIKHRRRHDTMSDTSSLHTAHPHASQACKRCSVNKKKCDRRLPRCTACVTADASCEAPIKAGDRRLMRHVEELRDENRELKNQIAILRRELNSRDGPVRSGDIETSLQQQAPQAIALPLPFLASNDHPILLRYSRHQTLLHFIFVEFGLQEAEFGNQSNDDSGQTSNHDESSGDINHLPSMEDTRTMIRALLESAKHGPSNLDKIVGLRQLEEDCHLVYSPGGLTAPEYAGSRFRCFTTLYLAMCMAAAANGDEIDTNNQAIACRTFGLKELASVTSREDLACVEALTLLCELAIHAPGGPNLWQLVGLATRTAIAINLHRKDDIFLPTIYPGWPVTSEDSNTVSARNQRRKDLFWALYSLDRLTVFILNRPVSIREEDIDVDLPPSTMWPEGKYATVSSEALWVHHLQARRLYGQIHGSLHGSVKPSTDEEASRHDDVIARYMQQVQQWYMKSRFNATVIPFSEESIKRHVLDDVQYHQMVMALHQPSVLIPNVSSASIATLTRSASLSVNLFHHAASRKQMNIHWVNIYHVFTSCAILIYCFREHQLRSDLIAIPQAEVTSMISRSRQALALFRGVGSLVGRYEDMFSQLVHAFETSYTFDPSAVPNPASPSSLPLTHQQTLSPLNPSNVDSDQDPSAAFAFDVDMIFDGLMPEGRTPIASASPAFAEAVLPTEQPTLLSPTYWADASQNTYMELERSDEGR
ncbi:hypothetical protein BU24DRAFT_94379 [Aaosphaeria arxii CBS 175.79]|uniref:Zn(2)-C6 fungal-type domain-containing protein n=1 Tax=Aaosphaeria arxii CBS 175.79 TaxID=1450172 RepID=A0A6A5X705_9PLEO|nr:uncharacterized protein BU24DRAFT_94379 [Aaosphaeria arxii CBS 175.79]KAF2008627.1 hypothetical protein BU24DRAFT_94379 [Aaosphaeria arxii CBS 175.79]